MGDTSGVPVVLDCRKVHCLSLDFLAWHLSSFGETHANLSWSCREPQIYVGQNIVEGPDLILVYNRLGGDKKKRGVPVELKTGNLSQRDESKAYHQLWSGVRWLEQEHDCGVHYGVIVNIRELSENPVIKYERIDIDKLREHCRPRRRL